MKDYSRFNVYQDNSIKEISDKDGYPHEFSSDDTIDCFSVAINEDGWELMEYESYAYPSFVSIETVCKFFDYDPDLKKGYLLKKDNKYYCD